MKHLMVDQKKITDANRKFYDAVASSYERIDGRRTLQLEAWLRRKIADLRMRTSGERLLDLGAGSGLVTRCASGLFKLRTAIDISPRMLSLNRKSFDSALVADINKLPFASSTFDMVTCFSVLHHLYNFNGVVSEVARVLRPGGIFYSDHDIEKRFSKKFRYLLILYRKLCDKHSKYFNIDKDLTSELYHLTEYQGSGIDAMFMKELFTRERFAVEIRFHWYGLNMFTDKLFGERSFWWGWAPSFSCVAVKIADKI